MIKNIQYLKDNLFLKHQINNTHSMVIRVLLYFDVFNYPLLLAEIKAFLPIMIEDWELISALEFLVAKNYISFSDGYYFLNKADNSLIERRILGNKAAVKMMKTANKYAKLISLFPFVRCVCISGSLSKGYIDEQADIDYFIITEPKRLWIARSFLILFKKVFLLNSRKYFCVNYFIDTKHLEIEDKNIFTATELLTLIPMNNLKLFEQFIAENTWVNNYLPNYKIQHFKHDTEGKNFFKKAIEFTLSNSLGEYLDNWFMFLTIKRWKKKFPEFNEIEFEQSMRSRKYVSKHHPQNFQKKVLNKLELNKKQFEFTFDISL